MDSSEKRSTWLFEIPEEGAVGDLPVKRLDRVDVSPMGTEGCLWWDWDFSFCDPDEPAEETAPDDPSRGPSQGGTG